MYIQFDSEPTDPNLLLKALKDAGHPVLSLKFSRWIRLGHRTGAAFDNGSRLDVEVPDDYILTAADGTTPADKSRALARTLAAFYASGSSSLLVSV